MDAVMSWLYVASISIGFVLVGLAIFVSIGLIVAPDRMQRTMRASNERYSLRKALKPVEIPRDADRLVYRHHRFVGFSLVLASSFFLFTYLTDNPQVEFAKWLAVAIGTTALSETLYGLGGFLAVGNFVALILGIVLVVRPSALKPVESVANRWFSTRRASRPLDREYGQVDTLVWQSPRIAGGILLLAALFVLVNIFRFLLEIGAN